MTIRNYYNRDLSNFSLIDILSFLKKKGWVEIEKNTKAIIFENTVIEKGNPVKLIIPANENNTDYFERVNDFVQIFSALLNISRENFINILSKTKNDILRMSILNPFNFSFSIPLDVASIEIDALKRFFIYSASSEEKARPFFEKPTTIGINHANYCQFGHTYEGSFGFTINSPLALDYDKPQFFEDTTEIPFERRVMERIVNSFIDIDKAVEKKDTSQIVDNFETGLNSRMCDALIDISLSKTQNVEFLIDWSYQIEPSKHLRKFNKMKLSEVSFEIIESAAKELKKVEPFDDIIIGKIITLHSNKIPFSEEEFPRIAIIKHFFEGKTIEVKLELTREEYKIAYQAHGEGKAIKVVGKLYRKGNTWRMVDISNIDIFHSQ